MKINPTYTLRVLQKKTPKLCDVTINQPKEVKQMTPLCVSNQIKQLNNRIGSPPCCFGALNDSDESLPGAGVKANAKIKIVLPYLSFMTRRRWRKMFISDSLNWLWCVLENRPQMLFLSCKLDAEAARRSCGQPCPTASTEVRGAQNHHRCRWRRALSQLRSYSTIAPHPQ